jgi:MFS transporter, UMF1 family
MKINKPLMPVNVRGLVSWCLFDWAHSAFPTVIITFIFSTYFIREVAHSTIHGTAYWGWAIGASGIVVALFSPIFGSIADYTGRRKLWLATFTLGTIIFTALLYFTRPSTHWIWWALIIVGIANACYEFTQIFYNAIMTNIVPSSMLGRVSGWGWGVGYLGGLVCLSIALLIFVMSGWFTSHHSINVRIPTLLVAVWFFVFSIPLFLYTPDNQRSSYSFLFAVKKGLVELFRTLKQIRHYSPIFLFLIARLIYTDGLNTLFAFGGIFAAGTFHMDYMQILVFAIVLNVTAGLGALLFAWIDDWIGAKHTILISLIGLMISGFIILTLHSIGWFWVMSAVLGIFVGPVQAASRSYMARIAPPQLINQMFGIYQLSGRVTAFLGPILVSTLTIIFNNQRAGMAVIFVMVFIGFLMLLFAKKY